ncbi:hypothetical protein NUM3379_17590 [Kineococcus sp. NUM-3379]
MTDRRGAPEQTPRRSAAGPAPEQRATARVSLPAELRTMVRHAVAAIAALLVVALSATGYLLTVSHPQVRASTDLTRALRISHEAMLDQETGLRAWVATGDEEFLESYRAGHRTAAVQERRVEEAAAALPGMSAAVRRVLVAQRSWQLGWVPHALEQGRVAPAVRTPDAAAATTTLLLEGKAAFDAYRDTYDRAIAQAASGRDRAVTAQALVLRGMAAALVLFGGLALLVVRRRARRIDRLVAEPVRQLAATATRVQRGEDLAGLPPLEVGELDDVAQTLARLAQDLHRERDSIRLRAEQSRQVSDQRKRLLTAAQAMASCGTVQQLAQVVVTTAAEFSQTAAGLWLYDGDTGYRCAAWSGAVQPSAPTPLVRRVGHEGLRREDAAAVALPLHAHGRVLAVLYVERFSRLRVPAGVDTSLASIAVIAAAHLQALELLEETRATARVDQLTGVGNRRLMDEELAAEWARSVRHDRPLSVALLDLDHFKKVNDTAGHLVGDRWLQLVTQVVREQLRSSDRVYRYGGEEIAVLLPETAEADAAAVLERIRAAVAATRGPQEHPHVTTSAGVAELALGMTQVSDLLAAADGALYAAKRAGRDRVARAACPGAVGPAVLAAPPAVVG